MGSVLQCLNGTRIDGKPNRRTGRRRIGRLRGGHPYRNGGPVDEPTYGGQFNHQGVLGVPGEGRAVVYVVDRSASVGEAGRSADVLTRPGHHYTLALLAAQPQLNPDRRRDWVALSGDPADIRRTDELVLELFPDDEHLRRWITLAREKIHFQGLPARICWLGQGQRARFGVALNDLVASGELSAPKNVAYLSLALLSASPTSMMLPTPAW